MDTDIRMKPEAGKGYALSGKIMLSAILILIAVIVFMVVFHLYARWCLIHLRRRQLHRRRQRRAGGRSHIVLLADNRYTVSSADRGLEKAVLDSLPVYNYSSKTGTPSECAVCLSEFEEGEVARHLPKCSHSFHTDCIDMWFHSHSTCPLCRSPVEQVVSQMNHVLTVNTQFDDVKVPNPCSCSKSKMARPCEHNEVAGSTASIEDRRKGLDLMSVSVPPRRVHSEDDLAQYSTGYKSPGNRLAYLKRILTISIRSPTSGPMPCDTRSSSSMAITNGDLENCTRASSQDSSRVQTPR